MIKKLRSDEGSTLIEMLVVITLLAVVGGILTDAMINGMRNTRQVQNRDYSNEALQREVERIARDLRVADPIQAATATSITVDLYQGASTSPCVRRTWSLASGTLTSTTVTYAAWTSCSVYPATATPTSTVTKTELTSVNNATLFTYVDSSGTSLTSPTPSSIAGVHIYVSQAGSENRAGVSYDTSVGVRNETFS